MVALNLAQHLERERQRTRRGLFGNWQQPHFSVAANDESVLRPVRHALDGGRVSVDSSSAWVEQGGLARSDHCLIGGDTACCVPPAVVGVKTVPFSGVIVKRATRSGCGGALLVA